MSTQSCQIRLRSVTRILLFLLSIFIGSSAAWADIDDNLHPHHHKRLGEPDPGPPVMIGYSDGSVRLWDGFDHYIVQIKGSEWGSAVAQIVNWNNNQIVALANGAVEQWDGFQWKELRKGPLFLAIPDAGKGGTYAAPVNSVHLNVIEGQLVESISANYTYRDNVGVPYGGSGSEIDFWKDGNWTTAQDSANSHGYVYVLNQPLDAIEYVISQIIYDANTKITYVAYGDGRIRSWNDIFTSSYQWVHSNNGWYAQITQMAIYKSNLIAALDNGAVELWNGQGWSVPLSPTSHAVNQLAEYDGDLIIGLATGAVQEWSGYSWTELHNDGWSAPVTQLTLYNGKLIVGLGKYGAVEQYDGVFNWTELHGNSWGSPVTQITSNGSLIVGLANGSVEQWDGNQWIELQGSLGTNAVTQLIVR